MQDSPESRGVWVMVRRLRACARSALKAMQRRRHQTPPGPPFAQRVVAFVGFGFGLMVTQGEHPRSGFDGAQRRWDRPSGRVA